MAQPVIKIENLSKVYRLGEIGTGTLSHDLNRFWKMNILGQDDPYAKIGHVNDRTAKAEKGELLSALRDINLEVHQGEVLGIIGKNGAGKSTLLKILSRVTSPTTGSIKVRGRLASLLEVGTGFNPEMTGRENIYMNGTIMGMRRWEIDRKLDEIVEFAGVAKYLDTPTKRFSSGMTVRLGFAIAAHLEPEILVVDEVLAVGDAEFQKKAIGKMQDVSRNDGRTVLFVSHNMASISALCSRGIILKNGTIEKEGDIESIINKYLQINEDVTINKMDNRYTIHTAPIAYYTSIKIKNKVGDVVDTVISGEEVTVLLNYKAQSPNLKLYFYIGLYNNAGEKLLHLGSIYSNHNESFNETTCDGTAECKFPKLPLPNGFYTLNISLHHINERVDMVHDALKFQVESGDFYNTGKIPPSSVNKFLVEQQWLIKGLEENVST
jgi:lipopolysaccharide transport system ATP-binding protein